MAGQPKLTAIWICRDRKRQRWRVCQRYLAALSQLDHSSELIVVLVDPAPGSEMHDFAELVEQSDVECRVICVRRSCPDSMAIGAGLNVARGEWIAVLPTYLQIDPNDLRPMLQTLESGYDYVASWRRQRVDSWWGGLKSRAFNRLTRAMTGIRLHDINSGLRVMRRCVTEHVPIYGDLDRFLPIMAATQGYRVTEVPVRHLEERSTKGDNSIGQFVRRLLDLLTLFFLFKFTKKPLRFFGLIGSATLAAGVFLVALVIVQRMLGDPLADRPALLFGVLMLALGVQLFSVGLLGELIIFTRGEDLRDAHVETVYEAGGAAAEVIQARAVRLDADLEESMEKGGSNGYSEQWGHHAPVKPAESVRS